MWSYNNNKIPIYIYYITQYIIANKLDNDVVVRTQGFCTAQPQPKDIQNDNSNITSPGQGRWSLGFRFARLCIMRPSNFISFHVSQKINAIREFVPLLRSQHLFLNIFLLLRMNENESSLGWYMLFIDQIIKKGPRRQLHPHPPQNARPWTLYCTVRWIDQLNFLLRLDNWP